jgi:transcriptional regulator
MAKTTLAVSDETHEVVRSKNRGGETFDTLIRRVFEEYQPDT